MLRINTFGKCLNVDLVVGSFDYIFRWEILAFSDIAITDFVLNKIAFVTIGKQRFKPVTIVVDILVYILEFSGIFEKCTLLAQRTADIDGFEVFHIVNLHNQVALVVIEKVLIGRTTEEIVWATTFGC